MEMVLFLCFLLVAAVQDIRRKQVDIRVYAIFGIAGAALGAIRLTAVGVWYGLPGYVAAMSVGAGMVGLSLASGGSVGLGDGLFFVVSGLMLGFWENLALLLYGTLCCGIFCLIYYVWCRLRSGRRVGKQTVPFLPFTVLPGIWLAVRGLGEIWGR